MKTLNNPSVSKLVRLYHVNILTLAAALIMPAATGLAQTQVAWQGPNPGVADYTNAADWVGGVVPTGSGANANNDNGSNSVVLIEAGLPTWSVNAVRAGTTVSGASGSFLQTGGTLSTILKVRMGVVAGAFGFYTLSNGVINSGNDFNVGEAGMGVVNVNGGTINLTGSGYLLVNNYNFVNNAAVNTVTDVLNQTAGNITITGGSQFAVGNGGPGIYNLSGGTNSVNNYIAFGRSGGNGTVNMTGGLLVQNGGGNILVGTGFQNPAGGHPVGVINQSGGIISCQGQFLVPENSPAVGTYNLSGTGMLTINNWLVFGRGGGTGVLNLTNGTIAVGGSGSGYDFLIGTDSGSTGTVNQYGGVISNTVVPTYIGNGGGSGTWNFNGGTAQLGLVDIIVGSGSHGTLNLNGGVMTLQELTTANNALVSQLTFNGGTLQASGNNATFLHDISLVNVSAGGAIFNSQSYNITVSQPMPNNGGDGSGGLTKLGSGTLKLTGANSYSGPTIVGAGTVLTTTLGGQSAPGGIIVSNTAGFGVTVVNSANSQYTASSISFVDSTASLNIDLGSFGNPTAAPLSVTSLANNATVTVNVASALPAIGQFPLLQYTGAIVGSGSFVTGTLPLGSVGYVSNNVANSSIDLVITSAGAPRWNGNVNGIWDINTTANWYDLGTMSSSTYHDGTPVLFDDNATGTTNVVLNVTVAPASVTFNISALTYTLTGTGKITGSTGLTLQSANSLALLNTGGNDFTGPVTISGGTLSVTNLANGGSPSAIGASSANPTNLILAASTLSYGGPAVSINRGYSLQNTNCTIDAEGNLTLSGTVTSASVADFIKTGPAQLTYATVGVNALSGSSSTGYRTIQGTTAFDGSSGGQTNNVQGHFGVGGLNGVNATVVLTNTTLNVSSGASSGFDLGRSGGATGTLSVNNGAVLNTTAGNFALGDGGGVVSTGVVNQAGGTVNVTGPQMFVGQNTNGVGIYNLSGGTLNINNWLAIGRQSGSGVFNLSGSAILNKTGNGNLDIGTSAGIAGQVGTGTLNQTGGIITNTTQTWLGEGASGEPATGTWNMSGGTAVLGEVHVGVGGTGTSTLNVSGSASITESYLLLANYDTNTTGNVNVGDALNPGGTITVNADMNVGGAGIGNLNFVTNGGGKLTVTGTLYLSRGGPNADGTVNLNAGGTLVSGNINNGWAFNQGTNSPTFNPNAFNFNGGTLKPSGTFSYIFPNVNTVVQAGGAIIDDNGNSVQVGAALVNGGGGGGLTKLGGGTLLLDGINTYTGSTMVTNGTLAGTGSIAGSVTVASGATLAVGDVLTSTTSFTINNTLTLAAGSTCFMKVTPSSGNDQVAGLTSVAYNGALVVTNASASPLIVGQQFPLFNAGLAGSGHFSSVTVLSAVGGPYSGSFNPATGVLTIGSSAPGTVNTPTFSSGNMTVTGSGWNPGGGYTWLATTNLAPPIVWTTNTTGTFSATGTFTNSFAATNPPTQFFRLRTP